VVDRNRGMIALWVLGAYPAMLALDWFFARLMFSASDFMPHVEIPELTTKRILREVRAAVNPLLAVALPLRAAFCGNGHFSNL